MTKEGYLKHKEVIDWFYSQEGTTCILIRDTENNRWLKTNCPTFSVNEDYLINDEYVEFRKAIYDGKEIEAKDVNKDSWITMIIKDPNEKFYWYSSMYRIKEDKFPIYKKNNFMVVKFVNEEEFKVLFIFNKEKASEFAYIKMLIKDENVNDKQWEDVLYDKKTDLWDGQPVWCIDKDFKTLRSVKFYDAKNKCTFSYEGKRGGCVYDNHLPYEYITDEWIIEAYKRLEF